GGQVRPMIGDIVLGQRRRQLEQLAGILNGGSAIIDSRDLLEFVHDCSSLEVEWDSPAHDIASVTSSATSSQAFFILTRRFIAGHGVPSGLCSDMYSGCAYGTPEDGSAG